MRETAPANHLDPKREQAIRNLLFHLIKTCPLHYVWARYMLIADKMAREYAWYTDWLSIANEARRRDGDEELYDDICLEDVLLLLLSGKDMLEDGAYRDMFVSLVITAVEAKGRG